jgi:hypothetical protein
LNRPRPDRILSFGEITVSPRTSAIEEISGTRSGKLSFHLGLPNKATLATLYDEMDDQRACQAFLWALPIVATEEARQAREQNTGARNGDLAFYEGHRWGQTGYTRDHRRAKKLIPVKADRYCKGDTR